MGPRPWRRTPRGSVRQSTRHLLPQEGFGFHGFAQFKLSLSPWATPTTHREEVSGLGTRTPNATNPLSLRKNAHAERT